MMDSFAYIFSPIFIKVDRAFFTFHYFHFKKKNETYFLHITKNYFFLFFIFTKILKHFFFISYQSILISVKTKKKMPNITYNGSR